MLTREDLKDCIKEALRRNNGQMKLIDVAKDIWSHHESELRASGDLFFSWQYDMRWACTALRGQGVVETAQERGVWKLVQGH